MGKDYWKKTPAKPVVVVGVDAEGNVDPTRTAQVALSGSNGELDLQGPIAAIPAADSVPQNSTYFALDTGELLWTDGETWQPVGGGS